MKVHVAESRVELGQIAARDIGEALRRRLKRKDHLRLLLAAAPSQDEMLTALRHEPGIPWQRITAFHMDEYIGLPRSHPQRFANWLRHHFIDHLPFARFEPIDPGNDPEVACQNYATLLAQSPLDMVLLGIGTNGHLAFNDPPADLQDPMSVKVVQLDQVCREQQVQDGCFSAVEDVPKRAITLTIPMLLSGEQLFCCVPGRQKSAAVRETLESPISGNRPSTALRTHSRCTLYLDQESSSMLKDHDPKHDHRP